MKVLIVSPSIHRTKGGIATVVNQILESDHRNHGFEMEHLITHVEGSIQLRVYYFLKSVFNLLLKKDVKLMHIHVASKGSFLRKSLLTLVGRLKGIPVIMHVHACDFDVFFERSSRATKYLIRKTFRACENVLVLSNSWYQYFTSNIITESNHNVEILFNGVPASKASGLKMLEGSKAEFLFLGRLGQRKGVYDLIEAVNIVVNQLGRRTVKLYLAGDGELEKVAHLLDKYGLADNVSIVGWLDSQQKMEHLTKVFTLVLPSYNEGLPMAILEAMSHGKVIISSKVGGIPELIEENVNGFLINPGNIDEIVQSILKVMDDVQVVTSMPLNNLRKIQQFYSLDCVNNKLFGLYSKALSV